jgi:hypothetical protein
VNFTLSSGFLHRRILSIANATAFFEEKTLGLEQVRIAPRSPWQSPYVERLIGSVRRDCLDHLIVLNQAHLHRVLESY